MPISDAGPQPIGLDIAALERAFGRNEGRIVQIVQAKRSPVGLSRETWFLKLRDTEAGRIERCVMRRDLPVGSFCATTLVFEYEVYRKLACHLPVAAARWFDAAADDPVDGRGLYIRDYVDGSPEVKNFTNPDSTFDRVRLSLAMSHARMLARIHGVDWRAAGLDTLLTMPTPGRRLGHWVIDGLVAELREIGGEPIPLLEEAIGWLRSQVPADDVPVCLLKGSNGYSQEVWRDGEIVALSDWELASLGDPAYDWARCGGFMSMPISSAGWSERTLLDEYERVSGRHISDERLAFYRLIFSLEMWISCHRAAQAGLQGRHDARLAYLASTVAAGKLATLAAAMGIA